MTSMRNKFQKVIKTITHFINAIKRHYEALRQASAFHIPTNRHNGFLIGTVEKFGSIWEHYCAIWSWTGVFHYREYSEKPGYVRIIQNNLRHDMCWCLQLSFSIVSALLIIPNLNVKTSEFALWIFAFSVWSVLDLLIDSLHVPLFGLKNHPSISEVMPLHRAQRRLLLTWMYFIQLIFFYAVIYWVLQERFGLDFIKSFRGVQDALQMSIATITMGYGTYAPADIRAVLITMVQALTGLLMIGGTIAQMGTMLKTEKPNDSHINQDGPSEHLKNEGKETTEFEWRVRLITPPLVTTLIVVIIYLIAASY